MDDVSAILRRDVSGAAFRRLLTTGTAAPISDLAADLDRCSWLAAPASTKP